MNQWNKNINIRFNILAIICIIIFCFALTPKVLQNDTFYTIRIGESIVNNGIDMQDHFSWHKDLPYTYPHWAYDTGIYLIYHLGEMTGITDGGMLFIYISTIILACTLGILIYVTATKISKNNLISFILTMFVMYLMKDFIAARAQLLTFNLFVLTVLFIENFLSNKKKGYLIGLIIISIVIANVHVAVWPFFFVLFLPYVAEYLIAVILEKNIIYKIIIGSKKQKIKLLENKLKNAKYAEEENRIKLKIEKAKLQLKNKEEKESKIIENSEKRRKHPYKVIINKNNAVKWLILTMIICTFTGLLTPLGDTPYTYLIKTMEGNSTDSISEHQPLVLYDEKDAMIVIALIMFLLIFTDVKMQLRDLFMIAGLIFMSFMSRRQVSLLLVIGVFSFAKWIDYLIEKYDKGSSIDFMNFMTTLIGKVITIVIVVFISFSFYKSKLNDPYIDSSKYPVDAATWMLENLDVDNIKIYNEYNYGSYLLYRGIPVFIDSRADLYTPEFNKNDEQDEGRDIFSDYINISTIGTYYETKFTQYEITHVIVVNNAKLNMFLSRNDEYKKLYKDDHFTIYEREAE